MENRNVIIAKGKRIAIALCVLLALSLAGCGSETQKSREDSSLQKILDSGELILGLDTAFPPMGFIDGSGEIVGFDIDVAQEVCDRMEVALIKKGINWDEKEDDLNAGRIDCIWSGMSVTPGRVESMCLSEPYMKNEFIFLLRGNSTVSDLNDLEGKLIGVQTGSTAEEALMGSELYSKVQTWRFDDNIELLKKLEQGEMDAALVDSVVAYYFVNNSKEPFFILPDSFGEDEYAIGFRKEDQALRDRVQEILGEMRADGKLAEIAVRWFGSDITTVR
ncbi:MAG: amino acid ABC transporter substrate-binding protein [Clostridiales bacterium]|nr:amino acid ABC transporter substrate-binding protein [Clostridiales bacterium]